MPIKLLIILSSLTLFSCTKQSTITLYIDNKYSDSKSKVAVFYQQMNGMDDCREMGRIYFKSGYTWNCLRD